MKILKSLKAVARICSKYKKTGKTVGLVVGGFDVLHMGHINLFRFAKRRINILIVGLDSDETLKITKGRVRPINNYHRRSQFLSEICLVDHIFKIDKIFKHGDKLSTFYFEKLYKQILPTHIFTHIEKDRMASVRKRMVKPLGVKFVPDTTKFVTTTSEILAKLESET